VVEEMGYEHTTSIINHHQSSSIINHHQSKGEQKRPYPNIVRSHWHSSDVCHSLFMRVHVFIPTEGSKNDLPIVKEKRRRK
jgi:hypothetical protein